MKYLLSVPPSLARCATAGALLSEAVSATSSTIHSGSRGEGRRDAAVFWCSDPVGTRLGSGSGTTHLLEQCFLSEAQQQGRASDEESFHAWLPEERRVVIHAGGQNRRLPSYGPGAGKALTPIPPFPGLTGQRIDQTLLSLQAPLYRAILQQAPAHLNTLIACGDVYLCSSHGIPTPSPFVFAPSHDPEAMARREPSLRGRGAGVEAAAAAAAEADIVCFGVAKEVEALRHHGVFFTPSSAPTELSFMLQKPQPREVHAKLAGGAYQCLMDVGLWLLSAKAVRLLRARSRGERAGGGMALSHALRPLDLYTDIGFTLGRCPHTPHEGLNELRVRILPLPGTSFYHVGTTHDLVASTVRIHNQMLRGAAQGRVSSSGGGYCCGGDGPVLSVVQPSVPAAVVTASLSATPLGSSNSDSNGVTTAPTLTAPEWISHTHPTIIIQNSLVTYSFGDSNTHLWIENAAVGRGWRLTHHHVITGVPENDWRLSLPPNTCVDVVPVRSCDVPASSPPSASLGTGVAPPLPPSLLLYTARPYGYGDTFTGSIQPAKDLLSGQAEGAVFLGQPLEHWLADRALDWRTLLAEPARAAELAGAESMDIQFARLFPCVRDISVLGDLLQWMIDPAPLGQHQQHGAIDKAAMRELWLSSPRLSASELNDVANVQATVAQREAYQRRVYALLAAPTRSFTAAQESFFRCLDLSHTATRFAKLGVHLRLSDHAADMADRYTTNAVVDSMTVMHQSMFYARYLRACLEQRERELAAEDVARWQTQGEALEAAAFQALRAATTHAMVERDGRHSPALSLLEDQIVWGRCPARVDLSGGWTDTPPYSVMYGGAVVNLAVELNGQPPVQVYIKVHEAAPVIVLRSIDLGSQAVLATFDDIRSYTEVGSAFSIPKAALALVGFLPEFCSEAFASLEEQLTRRFHGKGLEVTLLVAIPAGSGLGTSSIVAGTVLQSLAVCCGLPWDTSAVCRRVLSLEQLLTTGGGWQDQYGGLFGGVKLIQSAPGFKQDPSVRWLPELLFTTPQFRACHLLYYTGLTRTAKSILVEIVSGMFLHERCRLDVLQDMQLQTQLLYDAITRADFAAYGALIAQAWSRNKALDSGTCTPAVEAIIQRVLPLMHGVKLAGAGGGGYMLMVAKDEACARRIREDLEAHPPNARARFVEMTLSSTGIQVSKS